METDISEMKPITGREIAVLLNPRPAVLVTCCDRNGKPNVLSIAWQTPLAHDPPMLGISVAARRFSYRLIAETLEYAVNVVGFEYREAVEYCGSVSGRDEDKLSRAGFRLLPARCIRPPLIAEALAHLECRVVEQVQTGDHVFLIGQVLHAQVRADSFNNGWVTTKGDALLCMHSDHYCKWTS